MTLKKSVQQGLFIQELGVLDDEIHIWFFKLAVLSPSLTRFESYLSEEELARANAFRFERDRQRYIVFHGAMREVLAGYLEISSPKALYFLQREGGKPYLRGIEFNLSHSQDDAVLAVSRYTRLGVDIESTQRKIDGIELAERFFHPEEAYHLKTLADLDRQKAFYQYWTAKEAFVKAIGEGVVFGLSSFCIDIHLPAIRWIAEEKNMNPNDWQLVFFSRESYQIALVYDRKSCLE